MKTYTMMIIALLCLVIIAFASAPARAEGETYSGNGYTITFPSGWEIQKGSDPIEVFALSPLEGEQDKFQENINIVLEDVPKDMTNQEYIDLSIDNAKKSLSEFKVVSRKKITIDGQPGEQMVYEHTYKGTKINAGQAIVINKGKSYVVTLSTLNETYAKYAPYLDDSLKTLKFK